MELIFRIHRLWYIRQKLLTIKKKNDIIQSVGFSYRQIYAGIAQSVEHFTRNEGVVGSSPISSLLLRERIRKANVFRILLFCYGKKFLLVLTMTLSNTMNIDGKTKITTTILIRAPLAIRIQRELIISMFE